MLILIHAVAIAMGIATVSMAVTMSSLSEPLRKWLGKRSYWLGKLFSCPYCFSHWVALAAVFFLDFRLPFWSYWISVGITTLVLVVMNAPFAWVLYKSYSVMGIED